MSGGSSDDAVLAIAHHDVETGRAVLDLLVSQTGKPPFNPRHAVRKFAGILKAWGLRRVHGDAPGRSSTLKLRNGETDESVMIFEEVAPVGARYGNAASQHHCWRD